MNIRILRYAQARKISQLQIQNTFLNSLAFLKKSSSITGIKQIPADCYTCFAGGPRQPVVDLCREKVARRRVDGARLELFASARTPVFTSFKPPSAQSEAGSTSADVSRKIFRIEVTSTINISQLELCVISLYQNCPSTPTCAQQGFHSNLLVASRPQTSKPPVVASAKIRSRSPKTTQKTSFSHPRPTISGGCVSGKWQPHKPLKNFYKTFLRKCRRKMSSI